MNTMLVLAFFLPLEVLAEVLRVDEALLHAGGYECDATSRLQTQCDGRQSCEVLVNERLCAYKHAGSAMMNVRYRCGQTRYRVEAPWGEYVSLYCESGRNTEYASPGIDHVHPAPAPSYGLLRIREARYGLPLHGWCDATWVIQNQCNNRSECSLRASNGWCGDPVPGEYKELQILFDCDGLEQAVRIGEGLYDTLRCDPEVTRALSRRPGAIQILRAEYGTGRQWCNARPTLASRCDGDYRCSFKVDNGLCGDPARNRVKELIVNWRCGDDLQEARFQERAWSELSCMQRYPRHERPHIPPPAVHHPVLKVLGARYGQFPSRTCDATHRVASRCDGKSVCKVKASNRLCGDPARGVKKVLKVDFACDGKRQTRSIGEGSKLKLVCP